PIDEFVTWEALPPASGEGAAAGCRIEVEAHRADGSRFPAELAVAEVRLPDRRLFAAYIRDLTEPRAAAAEIARQREALL
ncbi:PAS domain S-box protein, partial [Acinetobacter baumannii]